MLIELLAAAAGLGVAVLLVHMFQVANDIKFSVAKFKKQSKGLPIMRNLNIFNGHMDIVLHKRLWKFTSGFRKEYGDTFCAFYTVRPLVITHDLDLIKTMIVDNDSTNRIDRLRLPVDEFEYDTILFALDDQWRRLRKAIAPAFSSARFKVPNVLAEVQSVIEKFIDAIDAKIKRAEELEGKSSIVMDVEDHCHRLTLAQTFTSLYKQDNAVDFYAERDHWQQVVDEGMRTFTGPLMKLCITFPIFRPLVRSLVRFHAQGKIRHEIMGFIRRQTRMNLEAKQQVAQAQKGSAPLDQDNMILRDGSKFRRNMVDYVIDQFHEGKLTEREYSHSSFFLFLAANKTTADALSKLLYLLAVNPEKQEKLRQSIIAEGAESEYLAWSLNEALRLYPPVVIGCSRMIKKPIETREGYVVPEGTVVITPLHSIHRLREYWGEDADEFKPERWLKQKDFHPMQYMPFGAGRRACPGRDYAMYTLKTLMDLLMRRYKFEFVSGTNDEMLYEAPFLIFMVFDGPTNIRITRL